MPGFNLDDYEPVADRIERFWNDHPTGTILTELIHFDDKHFIVRATVWRGGELEPNASGYAEEIIGSTNVNRTSALENCETSAIGRALANLGYAVKNRASREEMAKAQPEPRPRSGPQQRTPRKGTTATETAPTPQSQVQASTVTEPSREAPDIELVRWVAKQKLALVDQLGGDKDKAKTIWRDVLSTYSLEPDQLPLKESLDFIESDLSLEVGKALEVAEIPGQEALIDPDSERPYE